MLRAALAVSVLLASLLLLSHCLLNDKQEESVVVPQLFELRDDEVKVIGDAADVTAASSPQDANIALVTNIDEIDVPSPTHRLAQRWGGRTFQRLRSRTAPTNRRPLTQSSKSRSSAESDKERSAAAQTGRPIASPPAALPKSSRLENNRRLPDRNRLEILKDSPVAPEGIDASDLVDPAAVPRQEPPNSRPTPAKSPVVNSQSPRSPSTTSPSTRSLSTKSTRNNLPDKPVQPEANAAEQPAIEGYYDADWYQPTRLDKTMLARRDRIRKCLDHYYRRPLNSKEHSPWSLMHTMIAWGSDSYIRAGGTRGPAIGTVHWLAHNGLCDGVRLLYVDNGQLRARTGPGLQGHDGQLLAMFAQTRVPAAQPIRVSNYDFQVHDLIEMEKATCRAGTELTFKLIGLAHYLHPDESWRAADGASWDIPKLIRAEIAAPINGVTCGGTHRLMGLSYAIRIRRRYGLPVDGQWARADKYTADYVNLTFRLQNNDGMFSSNFYRGKGQTKDMERNLKTTGHLLEWVVFAVPHQRLQDRRITRAVDQLTTMLMNNRYYDWPKGPIGHGMRALSLYNERVFNQPPGTRGQPQTASTRVRSGHK
jgi:hypothetical protein